MVGVLIGVGLVFWGWSRLSTARESAEWPTVEGVVRSAHVEETGGGRKAKWSPIIRYEYRVEGRLYSSDHLSWAIEKYDTRREAEEIVALFAPDTDITAYYNPADPSESVVLPDPESST